MSASILGLSKKRIGRVFDEMEDFAELDQFIDVQARHYSLGMYVRLGSRWPSTSTLTSC